MILSSMKGLTKMAETCIDYIRGEDFATYFSNDSSEMRYMETLFGLEGVEVVFNESNKEDGGIELRVPKKWFRRPKPPITRTLTDEQKQAAKERLNKARKAKNG